MKKESDVLLSAEEQKMLKTSIITSNSVIVVVNIALLVGIGLLLFFRGQMVLDFIKREGDFSDTSYLRWGFILFVFLSIMPFVMFLSWWLYYRFYLYLKQPSRLRLEQALETELLFWRFFAVFLPFFCISLLLCVFM